VRQQDHKRALTPWNPQCDSVLFPSQGAGLHM